MNLIKKLALVLAALAVGCVTALSGALPASADDNVLHDLVIKHRSTSEYTGALNICKDWGNTVCASGSPRGFLNRGANSKTQYGWVDADGFYKPAGYWSQIWVGPTYYNGCAGTEGKWCKLSGPGTKEVKLIKY